MKHLLYVLTILTVMFSCKSKSADTSDTVNEDKTEQEIKDEPFIYNVYKSDSLKIDVKNDNFNFVVLLSIGDFKKEFDLNQLNIPTKTPDDIQWANNEYACMMTWWSLAQSRHIFIPTKRTNELIYIDKDIEATDSVTNNVVYIDTVLVNKDKVIFKAENLLTRKTKALEIAINDKNGIYPFYNQINLTKDKVTIVTAGEEKSIDIKAISGL